MSWGSVGPIAEGTRCHWLIDSLSQRGVEMRISRGKAFTADDGAGRRQQIPIWIRNTFAGGRLAPPDRAKPQSHCRSRASRGIEKGGASLTSRAGHDRRAGTRKRLVGRLREEGHSVILISQGSLSIPSLREPQEGGAGSSVVRDAFERN